jgi:hypothetical protein
MLWRVALAITVGTSLLLYTLLPLDSDLLRFAFAGLAFGLVSRTLPVVINSIVSAQTLIMFRLKQSTSRALAIEQTLTHKVNEEAASTTTQVVQHREVNIERNRD